jgi:hypothetical protein
MRIGSVVFQPISLIANIIQVLVLLVFDKKLNQESAVLQAAGMLLQQLV